MTHLVSKSSRDAVHLLQTTERETPLYGKVEMSEVACGHALPAERWATGATRQLHLITCKKCWAIAHPAKSGMGMF